MAHIPEAKFACLPEKLRTHVAILPPLNMLRVFLKHYSTI